MTPASSPSVPPLLDAWECIAWSESLLARLRTAAGGLAQKPGFAEEKRWLEAAIERIDRARTGLVTLPSRAMVLPELAPLLESHAASLQAAAVDAVERLQAGIAFHAGSRAPLIEALYGRIKLPALRRFDRADFEAFCRDFEKRLGSSYARRMLADALLQPIAPAVAAVLEAIAAWRAAWSPTPPAEAEARALRDELTAGGARLELPLKQARLLAEAALAPLRGAFEESGLAQRPKRRGARPADLDTTAVDGAAGAPPGGAAPPDAPTSEELAELEALRGPTAPCALEAPPASAAGPSPTDAPAPDEPTDEPPEARPSPPVPASPRRRRARAASGPSAGPENSAPESPPAAP